MEKELISKVHAAFGNEIRRFCRESGVSHMDLIILIVSAQHVIIKFLMTAEVTPSEVADAILECYPDGHEKDIYKKHCMDGLEAAGELADILNDCYKKFPAD